MSPDQSEPYKGPLAVFTDEELKYIRRLVRRDTMKLEPTLDKTIESKIDRVLASDPKWRQPISAKEEMRAKASQR